ncbi:MAG: EF-P beta-lysylation protein EpmB [Arenimonas sp.]|nr:EF-P beta-lysylation protein EpmB [Arenimonas sp.]
MITALPLSPQPALATLPRWQALWRDAIRDPRELLERLGLPDLAARVSASAQGAFPMRVPRGFVDRMVPGDPHDPLLRQVLPLDDEDRVVPGFGLDAVGDLDASGGAGILHKYEGRALLVATGSCAVHCRYCFRRHFPYGEQSAAAGHWRDSLDYLARDTSVREVLLSGGDPLSLATAKLSEFTDALAGLAHVKRLRVHTRLPVVLPERVDPELLHWLAGLRQQVVVVVHANHGNEIDAGVAAALRSLRDAGATVLNQSVLLRGVNDSVAALAVLSERLFAAGTLPYYLHQLDRVAGSAHFEVPDDEARRLHAALAAELPGYLVPRLVREVAGAPAKLAL